MSILQVNFSFDHSCLRSLICRTLKPNIPVRTIELRTLSDIGVQLHHIADTYASTIESVTTISAGGPELEIALIYLTKICYQLEYLFVYDTPVGKSAVKKILDCRPILQEDGHSHLTIIDMPERNVTAGR